VGVVVNVRRTTAAAAQMGAVLVMLEVDVDAGIPLRRRNVVINRDAGFEAIGYYFPVYE